MSNTIYDFTIPVLIRGLTNLSGLLEKAETDAAARKIDPIVFAQSRLYPDMHPLTRQVQIACDTAKGAAARLAGIDIPKHEDTEVTLADLRARIAKTLDFVKSVTPAQLEGAHSRSIEMKFPNMTWKFTAKDYVADFVLPNFFFHESVVYALLRHAGVPIGKRDFLGNIQ